MEGGRTKNLRLALYCRVSTEEQREGQTIDSQVRELEKFAAERQSPISGIYKDEGWSGSILARPDLDRLRDDASRGIFDAVLINDVDRLARDVTHLGIIKRDLERRGVRVIFRKLPGESTPTHNLMVNVLGSFAEFERELIADRTRRGKRHKVEARREYLGAIAPYGFRYTPRSRSETAQAGLSIVSEEAAVVSEMYRWVDEDGFSAQKVVIRLNQSGLRPRKGGTAWQKSSVLRILRSQVYAGIWHYNKHQRSQPIRPRVTNKYRKDPKSSNRIRDKAEWIPVPLPEDLRIVDPDRWHRVQRQLDRNRTFAPRHATHSYFLKSLVRCGACSGTYVGDKSHGRFFYRCSRRCRQYPSISEPRLNDAVWNALQDALEDPARILKATSGITSRNGSGAKRTGDNLRLGGDSAEQIQQEQSRILRAYRLSIISIEQLEREMKALKSRKASVTHQLAEHDRVTNATQYPIARSLKQYCQLVARKLDSMDWEARQRLLRLLVKRVVFEGHRIRITAEVSLGERSKSDPQEARIATTISWHRGRNASYMDKLDTELDAPSPGAPQEVVRFELLQEIRRDT